MPLSSEPRGQTPGEETRISSSPPAPLVLPPPLPPPSGGPRSRDGGDWVPQQLPPPCLSLPRTGPALPCPVLQNLGPVRLQTPSLGRCQTLTVLGRFPEHTVKRFRLLPARLSCLRTTRPSGLEPGAPRGSRGSGPSGAGRRTCLRNSSRRSGKEEAGRPAWGLHLAGVFLSRFVSRSAARWKGRYRAASQAPQLQRRCWREPPAHPHPPTPARAQDGGTAVGEGPAHASCLRGLCAEQPQAPVCVGAPAAESG